MPAHVTHRLVKRSCGIDLAMLCEAGTAVEACGFGGNRGNDAPSTKEMYKMENVEIARILEEYADLLDIRDDNPFRVRSYRKAAQTVAGLSRPVTQLAEAGEDLTKLPGIGTSMATHLKEIVETGSLTVLKQMGQEFPE